ncbi:hypothetical protein ILYODFUR_004807 [Ilyodon furcidens]|uniref:Secretory carrier membrane protein n=1 Tax=Ilyodon furcidens TaxID=33524 RepID=A0ABV0UHH0_9TELE
MSDFDSNPFADQDVNPFQDPSVTQARQTATAGLEEYNPFTDAKPNPAGMAPKTAGPAVSTQPAIMKPAEEPPAYSQLQAQEPPRAAAELLRRQEELERKAAELDRREREMQSLSASGGQTEGSKQSKIVMFTTVLKYLHLHQSFMLLLLPLPKRLETTR